MESIYPIIIAKVAELINEMLPIVLQGNDTFIWIFNSGITFPITLM